MGKLGREQCFSTWLELRFPNTLLLWGRDGQRGRLGTARLRIPAPSVGVAGERDKPLRLSVRRDLVGVGVGGQAHRGGAGSKS